MARLSGGTSCCSVAFLTDTKGMRAERAALRSPSRENWRSPGAGVLRVVEGGERRAGVDVDVEERVPRWKSAGMKRDIMSVFTNVT